MLNMRMLTILLLLASSFRAVADFEAASQAYRNKDYGTAFEAFTELARSGDARSQTVLAMMYKYGESTPVDLEQAFHWYFEAASQGYPPAQYNVGIMLVDGVGVDADPEAAKNWLSRAVASGHDGARDKLSMLTGDPEIVEASEPIAWSQNWNLRLPNDIRFQSLKGEMNRHRVYRIQLGAMDSIASAERLWRQVLTSNESLFRGLEPVYREGQSGSSTVWKVQSGNFNSASSAREFCSRYKAADPRQKTGCIVVGD
jgi:hypothetical protein